MYFCRLLFICALIKTAMTCPPNCVCKWKGGKQSVECVNKSMITVPDGMDTGTQVLDFSGNNLKTVGREQFQRLGLLHLQKIFLSRCRLTALDDRTFRGLTNLVELDLSNNILPSVPAEIFRDLPSLMRLNLNGNPFKVIKSRAFDSLKYLVSLELSRCELETIERDAFHGLNALTFLKLDYNSLKYVPGATTIPRMLHGINLQHNPWFCDCNLTDLYSWLNVSNASLAIEPICDGPVRLRGAPIKLLDEQELACPPDVSPTSLYLEIAEGKNVSLLCRVNAVPEARVSWRFQDRLLHNDSTIAPGLHLYYYVEEGTVQKQSELFIFNTNVDDNGTFVCVAENQAGKAQSNYTIRIVLKEEPIAQAKRIPAEYVVFVCVASAAALVFALACLIVCALRYRVKSKRRKKKEKSKELALYNDGVVRASPITRSGETLSAIGDVAAGPKANGGVFVTEQGLVKMSSLAQSSASNACPPRVIYPCDSFTPEQNPDLINDTDTDRKVHLGRNGGDPCAYNASVSRCPDDGRGWTGDVPVGVCYNHFQTRDVQLTPEKFLVDAYSTDYGLPKVSTHFPPILPATAFYRTLPHRRHNTSACNNGPRYVRDAEFVTRSAQPASYEHFLSGDIRYNVEGYPKDSPLYTYTPHVSFSDTVQILGKSSDSSIESTKEAAAPSVPRRNEYHHIVGISLTNASAQTQTQIEDLQYGDAQSTKKLNVAGEPVSEAKVAHGARFSVCAKNITDSPDEGYVGECTDTTDV